MKWIWGIGLILLLFGCIETGPPPFVSLSSDQNINDLNDVQAPTPLNSQVLVYQSSTGLWVNQNQESGGGSRNYSGVLPIIVDNDANTISASSVVTSLSDGNNISISCTGSDSNGDCTINAVTLGGITDTTLDTNVDANNSWHNKQHTFGFSETVSGEENATIVVDPIAPTESIPQYFYSGINNGTPIFSVSNAGLIYGGALALAGDSLVFNYNGNQEVLGASGNGSTSIELPPETTILAGISISQNFSKDQNFVKVNADDLNVLFDANVGRVLRVDGNFLCDSTTCYRISDLNFVDGTGSGGGTADQNVYSIGIIDKDNNAFLVDVNALGHTVIGSDGNFSRLQATNFFGQTVNLTGNIDSTGDANFLSGIYSPFALIGSGSNVIDIGAAAVRQILFPSGGDAAIQTPNNLSITTTGISKSLSLNGWTQLITNSNAVLGSASSPFGGLYLSGDANLSSLKASFDVNAKKANFFDLNIGSGTIMANNTNYSVANDLNFSVLNECSGDTNNVLNSSGQCVNISGFHSGGGGSSDVNNTDIGPNRVDANAVHVKNGSTFDGNVTVNEDILVAEGKRLCLDQSCGSYLYDDGSKIVLVAG